jgi:hypothetical protein
MSMRAASHACGDTIGGVFIGVVMVFSPLASIVMRCRHDLPVDRREID